jgi:hypothetical protein
VQWRVGEENRALRSALGYEGWGELSEPSTLPASLRAFRSSSAVNHPGGKRRLEKLSDLLDLGSELSVPPNNKPHGSGKQYQRPRCLLATKWEILASAMFTGSGAHSLPQRVEPSPNTLHSQSFSLPKRLRAPFPSP